MYIIVFIYTDSEVLCDIRVCSVGIDGVIYSERVFN